MKSKAIFWDCDGTLMYGNESFLWALDRALRTYGYEVERSVIKAFLVSVCSWFATDKPHADSTKEKWWQDLLGNVKIFCGDHNVEVKDCDEICKAFRQNVINYEYELYPDAEDILQYCKEKGYENYLISNNFPELVQVFERLGLDKYFSGYFLSANIGYEKPQAEIYEYALQAAGHPDVCYMVGDNPVTDVQGGKAVGMKTILVHRKSAEMVADFCCEELSEIKSVIIE